VILRQFSGQLRGVPLAGAAHIAAIKILAEFWHRTGHEHPHFRTAINNYARLISAMDLSQNAIAARVRSAIEGEPEESA